MLSVNCPRSLPRQAKWGPIQNFMENPIKGGFSNGLQSGISRVTLGYLSNDAFFPKGNLRLNKKNQKVRYIASERVPDFGTIPNIGTFIHKPRAFCLG